MAAASHILGIHAWTVPAGGYLWHSLRNGEFPLIKQDEDRFILCQCQTNELPAERHVSLSGEEFRLFAATEPEIGSTGGICRFANTYGSLTHRTGSSNGNQITEDETLPTWRKEILGMRYVVELWDAAERNDRHFLAKYIHWSANKSDVYFLAPVDYFNRGGKQEKTPIDISGMSVTSGDLIMPATLFVRDAVSKRLAEFTKAKLLFTPELAVQRDAQIETVAYRLALQFASVTLLQVLWMQAAFSITEGRSFMPCVECSTWFTIPPRAPKTRLEFCSDSCRVRAYRRRQDQAWQMATDGKNEETIAKELGSDLAVVKRWIAGRKKKNEK